MNESFDAAATALRQLEEDLTRSVAIPPVDSIIRRADGTNRTVTAATAAVLTVGALGGVTVVAQSVVSGAAPLPVPVALAPAPPAVEQLAGPPAVAEVLNAGEQVVRLQPAAVAPPGSRLISNGFTVLAPGTLVPVANTRGTRFDSNGNSDVSASSSNDTKDSGNAPSGNPTSLYTGNPTTSGKSGPTGDGGSTGGKGGPTGDSTPGGNPTTGGKSGPT